MFFVMLNGGGNIPVPLIKCTEEDYEAVMLFGSYAEAWTAGEESILGAARGFEVYAWSY